MRHILILTIFMVPHAALAQDYIRCTDANKLCKVIPGSNPGHSIKLFSSVQS